MMYLDNAATSPVLREVLEAMWPYLTADFGNPSSHHEVGEAAARGLAAARERIAAALDCRAAEIVFTSGGTEANNLAVKGIALAAPRGRQIVTTAIEHEAVLASCDYLRRYHGFEITLLPLGDGGLVDPDVVAAALRPDTTLVSIMHANNEIGTVQPIRAIADVARAAGVPMHTDAVQSAPWLEVGLRSLGVDALSISGHKLGAPKGSGLLAVRGAVPIEALLHGGGQERGRRSGTENVAGAVGLAEAIRLRGTVVGGGGEAVRRSRDAIIDGVLRVVPGAFLTGHRDARLPAHASFCFPGTSGEAVLLELERRGIVSSSGSACAAGSDDASHVLVALGIDDDTARTAVRFSLDSTVDEADAARVVSAVADAVAAVGSLR
ncbi:cysteine desulfurase family protein [Lacisediminihabitans profunda]|uniref:cysteine desulfurase n=1 Tax=Lacisediminihabitans profunda TaxID=2594790 RepID=A0A5C8UXN2_9MICO|nr:cysteine desulfurase family protein [Lacisediminihabitans profunda]TXN32873.1 cysteine desulfurase [Lacisediminihabitans profunda]